MLLILKLLIRRVSDEKRGLQESKSICGFFGGSLLSIYEASKVLSDIVDKSPNTNKDLRIDVVFKNNSWLDSAGKNLTIAVNEFTGNDTAIYEEWSTLTINPYDVHNNR